MEFAKTSPKNLKLVLTARRLDTLKQVAEEIKQEVGEGVKVLPVKLDVSKPEEVKGFVDSLPTEFKEIDILVNNAYVSLTVTTLAANRGLMCNPVVSSKEQKKPEKLPARILMSCSPRTSQV